jgi:hypothetical protein
VLFALKGGYNNEKGFSIVDACIDCNTNRE